MLTLAGSVSSLTLKRMMCSMTVWVADEVTEDMVIMGVRREGEGLEKRRRCLEGEKVRENEGVKMCWVHAG